MQNKALAPMSNDYHPEIDISPDMDAIDAAYYQSLIGTSQLRCQCYRHVWHCQEKGI